MPHPQILGETKASASKQRSGPQVHNKGADIGNVITRAPRAGGPGTSVRV